MDVDRFLAELKDAPGYSGQIVHLHEEPARAAVSAAAPVELREAARRALSARGIDTLYSHQAQALSLAASGANILIATGTASGKSLCYLLPIIERLDHDPAARVLLLFPTKALCQDQFQKAREFLAAAGLADRLAGVLDGDTPAALRRRLRDNGRVIFSNPDMVHASLMPQHGRWAEFIGNLTLIVVDELHVYSGIFGANMALLIQRFLRLCTHYGSNPQWITCSATIANPIELVGKLTGQPFELISQDGSPRGRRVFVCWNPPRVRATTWRSRRSANVEAHELMARLIAKGIPTITFSKAKMTAEMIYRYVHEKLLATAPGQASRITPYRGGYRPQERRQIEKRLFDGELLGVSTTPALELGIDVGNLEASIIVGYPGTRASFFQQAGRAGRRDQDAVVFLIGLDTSINQYIMTNPDYVFETCIEQAVIDRDNPFVATGHLRCATHEIPLHESELPAFGPHADLVLNVLNDNLKVRKIEDRWYYAASEVPHHEVSLRAYADANVLIEDADSGAVLGEINRFDAEPIVHPEAIYMHLGDTYRVLSLDLDRNLARVKREEVDYYTQPLGGTDIHHIDNALREKPFGTGSILWGEVTAYFNTFAYERIHFYSLDAISRHSLELPTMTLETMAFWIVPPEALMEEVRRAGLDVHSGLRGVGYATRMLLPLFMTCDTLDFSHTVGSVNSPWNAIFVYERYPLGLGFTEKAYQLMDTILPRVLDNILNCPCPEGCPCCVGKPLRQQTTWNVERGEASIPSKEAAARILTGMLGDGTQLDNPDTLALGDTTEAQREFLEKALRRRLERMREPCVFHPIKPTPEVTVEYPAIGAPEALTVADVSQRNSRRSQFDRDLHKRIAKRIPIGGLSPLAGGDSENDGEDAPVIAREGPRTAVADQRREDDPSHRPAGMATRRGNLRPGDFPGKPPDKPDPAPAKSPTPPTGPKTDATTQPLHLGDSLAARARKLKKRKPSDTHN